MLVEKMGSEAVELGHAEPSIIGNKFPVIFELSFTLVILIF
jgi:hypothetical protein